MSVMLSPGIVASRPASGGGGYSGPLDLVPGALLAYSQRAMAAAWVSNAIEITRSSDSAAHSFATTTDNAVSAAAVTAFLAGTRELTPDSTIANGGTGYDDGVDPSTFDVTILGGTPTDNGTANVTTNGHGVVVTINSIGGIYSVVPTSPAATSGDDGVNHGTGLTLTLVSQPTEASGTVSKVYDQSGNDLDVVPEDTAPAWIEDALNGRPGIQRTTGNGFLAADTVSTSSSNYTFFAVVEIDDLAGFGIYGLKDATGYSQSGTQGTGAIFVDTYNNADVESEAGGQTSTHVATGQFYLIEGKWNFGALSIKVNGADQAIGTNFDLNGAPGGLTDAQVTLGSLRPGVAGGLGTMAEFLLYNLLLSISATNDVRQNIAAYYGITL